MVTPKTLKCGFNKMEGIEMEKQSEKEIDFKAKINLIEESYEIIWDIRGNLYETAHKLEKIGLKLKKLEDKVENDIF